MRLDFSNIKFSCMNCKEVYQHVGFPMNPPECPHCASKKYDIYEESTDMLFDEIPIDQEESLQLIEEYKMRLAFLMLQIKAQNNSSTFPF